MRHLQPSVVRHHDQHVMRRNVSAHDTPAEAAVRKAIDELNKLGTDPAIVYLTAKLAVTLDGVADFIEGQNYPI